MHVNKVIGLPALDDNYIWLIQLTGSLCVVDPGDAQPVIDWCHAQQKTVSHILLTHDHHDHIGGVDALLSAFPNAQIYLSASSSLHITQAQRVAAGDVIDIDNTHFQILDLSGHTPSQVGFYASAIKALFCGDALFACGAGRLFNGGTPSQMAASLQRISQLPSDTLIYCAHEYTLANCRFAIMVEPENTALQARLKKTTQTRKQGLPTVPSLLSLELETNPFLRTEITSVHMAIDQHAQVTTQNSTERFALLRAWKDTIDKTGILEVAP